MAVSGHYYRLFLTQELLTATCVDGPGRRILPSSRAGYSEQGVVVTSRWPIKAEVDAVGLRVNKSGRPWQGLFAFHFCERIVLAAVIDAVVICRQNRVGRVRGSPKRRVGATGGKSKPASFLRP